MRYRAHDETLTFSNGVSVNQLEMERGGFGAVAQIIFRFATAIYQMGLDEREYAMISVICLLSSGE